MLSVQTVPRVVLAIWLFSVAAGFSAPIPFGYWNFDLANREQLIYGSGTLAKNGTGATATGPNGATDGAVQISGNGGWYTVTHNMPPNGGSSSYVCRYTLMWDLKYPNSGTWKCLLQTNGSNANDGDLFIRNSNGTIGCAAGLGGYSSNVTAANTWYRIVMTCDTTLSSGDVKIYVNGTLWYTSTATISNSGTYALDPVFLISRDNDSEHDTMVLSAFATWNSALSASQVAELGGVNNVLVKNSQTVGFPNPGTKTYGDAAFMIDATASSGLACACSVVSGPATITGNTVTLTGAGDVTLRAEQAGDVNYNPVGSDQSFSVNTKLLTVTADTKTKTYGESDPTLTFTADGLVGGDAVAGALAREPGGDAGVYAIVRGTLDAGANYALAYTGASLTINKAPLVCRAADAARPRGEPNPTFAILYIGFVNGEDVTILDEPPTASTSATSGSPSGLYPITVQGGQDGNYNLIREQGTLHVYGRGTLIRIE